MKTKFSLSAICHLPSAIRFAAALLLAPAAHGQAANTTIMGANAVTTNNVAAASTNSYTGAAYDIQTVAFPSASQIGLLLSCKMNNATNSNVVFTFTPHLGDGNLSTVAAQAVTFTVTCATNTQVYYVTNQTLGAVPTWRLTSIGNTNAGAYVTNIIIKTITKNGI